MASIASNKDVEIGKSLSGMSDSSEVETALAPDSSLKKQKDIQRLNYMSVANSIAIIAVAVFLVIQAYGSSSSSSSTATCDVTGYYKCNVQDSFCVGTQGYPQNTAAYYNSSSNGNEYDMLTYTPTGSLQAPSGTFLHMEIYGGCADTPCGFHENELYTPVPGSASLNWEGFTVNRTGADEGQQVFYESLYFADDCNSYTKLVKGQQVQLQPAAVLCNNQCSRTTEAEYALGIQGGV